MYNTDENLNHYWMKIFPNFCCSRKLIEHINNTFSLDIKGISDYYKISEEQEEIEEISGSYKCDNSKILHIFLSNTSRLYPLCNIFARLIADEITDSRYMKCVLIKDKDRFLMELLETVCESLLEISTKTLLNELSLLKDRKVLLGETKEKRFEYFVNTILNDKDYQEYFFGKYKELYCSAKKILSYKVKYIDEILCNLLEYKDEICVYFCPDRPYQYIERIEYNKGDSHKTGKFVAIIEFDNNQKLVYKPRNLSLEIGFNDYLQWTNTEILGVDKIYIPKVYSKDSFGLVEYISYEECVSEEGIRKYYYKAGVLLAILYSLNAKDIHHENIIAHADAPVVIDLDALFHNCLFFKSENKKEKDSFEIAMEKVDSSVYTIGLLPIHISCNRSQEKSVDISGFGGEERQLSPFKIYAIKNRFTDEMCFEEREVWIETEKNIPKFAGKAYGSKQYKTEIIKGFTDLYLGLMKKKLQALNIIKKCFIETDSRLILRPTYLYGKLMNLSYNHEFMKLQADRRLLLSRLSIGIDKSQNEVVLSEIEDILNGDVPYFSTHVSSTLIYNSKGKAINIEQLNTALDIVIKKISNFTQEDLNEQVQIIENSFIGKDIIEHRNLLQTATNFECEELSYSKERKLQLAKKIAQLLIDKSVVGTVKGEISRSWVGYTPVGHDNINYQYGVNPNDLYNGNAGLALYFIYLSRVSKEKKYLEYAYETLNPMIKTINSIDPDSTFLIGPYNGLSGHLYTIHKLFEDTRDLGLLAYIRTIIELMQLLYKRDRTYDIIGGSGGALKVIMTLLKSKVYDVDVNISLLKLLEKITINLCKRCTVIGEERIAWECMEHKGIAFTGYAHGVSGILASLYLSNTVLHNEFVQKTVIKALNYERKLFNPEKKNWAANNMENKYSCGWCHGAPGILLSKSILIENGYKDSSINKEIEDAISTTIKCGFGNNICLCHGDIGNLEILKRISKVLDLEELNIQCDYVYGNLFDKVYEHICKVKVLPVGIMLGSAGVGVAALQSISDKIPSVLALE